jgi:hypothetical protein
MSAAMISAVADLLEASARVIRAAQAPASIGAVPRAEPLPLIRDGDAEAIINLALGTRAASNSAPSLSSEHVTRNLGKDGSDSLDGGGPLETDHEGNDHVRGSKQERADDEPARMNGDHVDASGGEGRNPLPETPQAVADDETVYGRTEFDPLIDEEAAVEWTQSIQQVPAIADPEPPLYKPKKKQPGYPRGHTVMLSGTEYRFTTVAGPMVEALSKRPLRLTDMVVERISLTEAGAKTRLQEARKDIKAKTACRFEIRCDKGLYTLIDTHDEDRLKDQAPTPPEPAPIFKQPPLIIPGSEDSVLAASEALQPPQPEPAPAPPAPPAPVSASSPVYQRPIKSVKVPGPNIEPGDLLAVDIKGSVVLTKQGPYSLDGSTKLGRALDKLKDGQMYGLDTIAKVGGWPNRDGAITSLRFEIGRLNRHGLDLYMDKINVRLKEFGK